MQHRDAVGLVGCGTEMLRAGRQVISRQHWGAAWW